MPRPTSCPVCHGTRAVYLDGEAARGALPGNVDDERVSRWLALFAEERAGAPTAAEAAANRRQIVECPECPRDPATPERPRVWLVTLFVVCENYGKRSFSRN